MARKLEDKPEEANLLPVMNVMLLMIPALLLAMEVARMGAIEVVPPAHAKSVVDDQPPPQRKPELHVFIAEDAIVVSARPDGPAPTRIPLAQPTLGVQEASRWDYPALELEARRLRDLGIFDPVVHVDAESSIPMSALVATLDALRGSQCRLGRLGPDEEPSDECLFWNVVVDPGSGHG